jgi:hypothetical protein
MNKDIEESDYYRDMNRVVEMYLKGTTNPTSISKGLSLPRKDVLNYIQAWKEIAKNNAQIKDRAAEALTAMDRHYDIIIKEMWDVVNDTLDLKVKASTLKQIADVEAKRQETLQKAGLYDDAGISDELVRLEEYTEAIKQVLFAVIKNFPMTKVFIMQQFSNIGNPTSVPEDDDDSPIEGEVLGD